MDAIELQPEKEFEVTLNNNLLIFTTNDSDRTVALKSNEEYENQEYNANAQPIKIKPLTNIYGNSWEDISIKLHLYYKRYNFKLVELYLYEGSTVTIRRLDEQWNNDDDLWVEMIYLDKIRIITQFNTIKDIIG